MEDDEVLYVGSDVSKIKGYTFDTVLCEETITKEQLEELIR